VGLRLNRGGVGLELPKEWGGNAILAMEIFVTRSIGWLESRGSSQFCPQRSRWPSFTHREWEMLKVLLVDSHHARSQTSAWRGPLTVPFC
jgi:hypothetical protein